MKYMILIYGNEEKWGSFTREQHAELVGETDAQLAALAASGELVGAYGVGDQVMAKTVVAGNGAAIITDGPFVETKEYLASFTIVDCDSEERALEIAAANPAARFGGAEVRPLMHESEHNG